MLFKLGSHDLKIGMFVAELDRPWIDTPFLIQGFLIRTPDHVERVCEHCRYVYVDSMRSAAGVLPDAKPRKAPHGAASGQHAAAAASGRPKVVDLTQRSPGSDELSDTGRFMRMAQSGDASAASGPLQGHASATTPATNSSLGTSAKRLFNALFGMGGGGEALPAPTRHAFIPSSIELVAHRQTRTVKREFTRASQTFDNAKYAMNRMVADLLAGKALNVDKVWEVIDEVVDSILRNPDALTWVAMTRQQDATLYGQGILNAVYLVSLGRHLGLPKEHLLRLGMVGALLDIGKTTLPLAVLTKPGQLTDNEFALVKDHVSKGLELIKSVTVLHAEIIDGIAQHHERDDGSGYPNGLKRDEMGLFGRMAAIVDCFVALTNERTYADTISAYAALRKLTEWSRTLLSAPLTEQFIQAIGAFPVGSIVELSSSEVAVVVHQNRAQRLKPQLLVVCGPDKTPLRKPYRIDLIQQEKKARASAEALRITRGLPSGSYGIDERNLLLS